MLPEKIIAEETQKFLEQMEKKQLRELKSNAKPIFIDRHTKVKYYEDVGEARKGDKLMRQAYCFLLHTVGKTYKEVGEIIGINPQSAAGHAKHFKYLIDKYGEELKEGKLDQGKGFFKKPDKSHPYYHNHTPTS